MFLWKSCHSFHHLTVCCRLEALALNIYLNCCLQLFATCCGVFLVVIIYQLLFTFGTLFWMLEGKQHKTNIR